jgi:GntR family transcriptional repressor for pyruvate dehydrogenase complex
MLEPIKTEKLYHIIMRRITDFIDKKQLGPGDRLPPERELAEALSVSRASIRQALTALATQGIVIMRQGDGTYVSKPDGEGHTLELFSKFLASSQINPDEIMEVRMLVECEAARFCAIRADRAQLEKIRDILDRKRIADEQGENLNLNQSLHFAIAEGAQNKALLKITQVIWEIMESNMWPLLKQETTSRYQQRDLHHLQHEEIVGALYAHDGDRAYKAMYTHLLSIKQDMDDFIK